MADTKRSGKKKKRGFKLGGGGGDDDDAAAPTPAVAAPAAPSAGGPSGDGAGASAAAAAPASAGAGVPPSAGAAPPAAPAKVVEFSTGEEAKRTFRFYRKDFPDVDEMVMVYVKSFKRDDPGATAVLLEYDGLEGMILTSELSKRRIRSVYKLLTVGSTEPVKVLRVDREKGYIDLSKRQADKDEKQACQERFYRSKTVNTILYKASRKLSCPLQQLYETVAWPLADKHEHALYGFNEAATNPKVLDLPGVDKSVVSVLLSLIRRKLAAKPVTVSVDVELACFQEIGIDAVVEALCAAQNVGTPELPVSAKVVAAPSYRLALTSADTSAAETKLREALAAAETVIKSHGGKMLAHDIIVPEQDSSDDDDSDSEDDDDGSD